MASTSAQGGTISLDDYFRSAGHVETKSGRIGYVERGTGPVALFVHGVLLNGWLWRNQLQGLAAVRAGSVKRVAASVGEGAAVVAQIHGCLAALNLNSAAAELIPGGSGAPSREGLHRQSADG
jgi:hypothetical protein